MNGAGRENPMRDRTRVRAERELGVPSLLLNLRYDNGWPDCLFLITGGRPLLMEFKRPGKDLEPLQVERRETLEKLNYDVVGPVDNVDEAMIMIQLALNRAEIVRRRNMRFKK